MVMSLDERWRKALVISLAAHVFILVALGYLGTKLFAQPIIIEQRIELDLAPSLPAGAPVAAAAPAEAQPAPQITPQQPVIPTPQSLPEMPADPVQPVKAAAAFTGPTENTTASPVSGSAPAGAANAGAVQTPSSNSSLIPPRVLSKIEAAYPSAARKAGQEGTVMLSIQILETGRPGAIQVAQSSGYAALDEAAIKAVRQWRFVPAKNTATGKSVDCYSSLPVSFSLY